MVHKEGEKRIVCLVQGNPCLQGVLGVLLGGALAATIDATVGVSVITAGELTVRTVNVSISFKRTALLDKVEERKACFLKYFKG